jgi:hypothetical protein
MQGDEKLRKLFGLIKTDKTMGPEYKDATYDEFKDLIVKDVDFRKDLHSDLTKFNIIDPQRTFDDFSKNVELNSGMGTTTAPVPTATAKPVQPAQQPSLTQMTRQQVVTPMKEPQPVKPVEPEKEKSGFGVIPFVVSAIKSVKGFFGNETGVEKGKKVAVNPSPLKSYEEAQTQYRNADKQFQELEKQSKAAGQGSQYGDYDFGTHSKLSKEIPGLKTNAEKSLLGAGPTIDKIINDAYKNADESKFMDYNPSTKKRIVSLDKIQNLSRQIAKQSGLPETGYAQQRIASQMKAYVEHKQIEPDVEKEVYKLLGNQTPKNIAQKEFEKVVKENTKIQGLKTQAEIEQKVVADQLNVEQKTITSQYEKDYKTLVADLNKESAADPEIETLRKTIIAEDKQTAKQIHEKYQQLVNSGKMTVIQATAARDKEYELFNDPKKLEEKKERINALAKQKYGAKYANAFQQYTNAMNATSTRFNRRYKREAGEIVGLANAKINAELEAVKKQYKTSPETVAKIEAAYNEAYGKVLKEKDLKEYAVDQSLGYWNQLANSTISSFGAGVSGYATTFGLGKVAQLGDVISNNFHPSNISITTAGDWLDPIKAAHGTGDLLGRMVPSILVGAATAAATQGAGVPMAARLMLTGFADMMAESADISGTIYKQMLDKTGSAVDAGNAARDAFEGNLYNYPAYVVGSLPFFQNALKGVPGLTGVFSRTAFGAGLEMVSETYTESVQGAQEKSILAGERLKDTFKELTIDHILETGVQMGPIAILGGAPHLFQGGRDVIEKNFADRAVNAFRAKEVLSTELNDENQAQFFAQIHNEKGAAFAKSMLGSLFIDGKITPEQNERLSTFINNYDNWSPQAKQLGLNGTGAKIGGILFNDLEQARASADPQLIKEAQSAFDNFLKTGNAELISVGLSDGSTYFYKPGEFSRMLDTPDFQKLIQDGSVKLSGMSSNMGTGEYKSLIEKVDMVGKAARPAAPLAPTQEQIEDDIKNKRFATFTYETEDQVPDELKDKINRRGDINGKPFVKVTIPQSQADYILAQQKQAEMEADTEFVTATPEELEAYRNGTLTDEDRIAGINDDALKIEQGAQTLEDLPDDPNYREMVKLKLAENQAAPAAQQGASQNVSLENRVKETENKIKNKNLFLAEVDENGNRVVDKQTGRQSQSVGEIISQSDDAPVPTSVREINGIEFVEFSNPKTGDVDVIVTGKNDGSYVGYYRLYDNGKPTNQWSSKFENPSRNKEDFKTMISGVQSMLPEGHEYTEKTSISTDGLRVWNQQLNRGYQLQYDGNGNVVTNKVAINGDAIVNELGIDVDKGSFENISVRNNADIKKVKQALLPYLQKLGLNESNLYFENGTVYIDLPVLKKPTNQAAATSQQTSETAPLPAAEGATTQQAAEEVKVETPAAAPTTLDTKNIEVNGITLGNERIFGEDGVGDVRDKLPYGENNGTLVLTGKDGNKYVVAFSRVGGDGSNIFEKIGKETGRPGQINVAVRISDNATEQEIAAATAQAEGGLQVILPTIKNNFIDPRAIRDVLSNENIPLSPAATSEQSNEAPAAAAPIPEGATETGVAESGRPVIPIELAREFLNIDRLVAKGFVNYVDSKTGKPCAKFGMRDNAFSRGGKWEIVKDLKGYATHEKGGVDLTIDGKGVRIGGPNSKFYAADGLLMPNNGEPVPAQPGDKKPVAPQPKPVKKARVYVRENDPVFNSEAKRSLPLLEQKYGKGNVQIIQIPQGNQKLLQAKLAEDLDADTFVYDHSGDDMLGIPVSGAMKNSVDLEDAFDVQNKAMEQSLGRKTTEDEREALYYKMLEKNTDHTGTWTWSFPENYKGCAYWGSCNFDTKASYFTQESKIPSYSTNFDKWHGVNSAVKPLKTDEDFLNQFYFGAKYNYHQPPTEEQ